MSCIVALLQALKGNLNIYLMRSSALITVSTAGFTNTLYPSFHVTKLRLGFNEELHIGLIAHAFGGASISQHEILGTDYLNELHKCDLL